MRLWSSTGDGILNFESPFPDACPANLRWLLGRLFGGNSGEVAGDTVGIDIHVAGDLAGVVKGGCVGQGNRAAVVFRVIGPGQFIAINAAGDRKVLFGALAGASELIVGLNELAFLIAFVAGDAVVDGPQARQVGGSRRQGGGCGEKNEGCREQDSHEIGAFPGWGMVTREFYLAETANVNIYCQDGGILGYEF